MNLELEIKYELPSPEVKTKILKDATLIKVERHRDSYFDREDYSLMIADKWLRYRIEDTQSKYWLKYKTSQHAYLEADLPSDISHLLGLEPLAKSATELYVQLHAAKIEHQFQFDVRRETYQGYGLTLCFDETNFGYSMLEVEKLVPNFTDLGSVTAAEKSIKQFAASMGLVDTNLLRKPVEYLRRNNPAIFHKLGINGFIETGQTLPS